ncbi:MAG TPA: permease prefix domain 1-containing protein [Lachnospiraceae bacterium]|nr:permease prefix domain 1-containing protein [Lachnospiraceae bacterium]
MDERIYKYIEDLFKDTPCTKDTLDLKEEMIQNLQEKYVDLLEQGNTKESAYSTVIANIGDIHMILDEMNGYEENCKENHDVKHEVKQSIISKMITDVHPKGRNIRRAISLLIWSVSILFYLVLATTTSEWIISLFVFLFAVILEGIINIYILIHG